MKYLFRCECGKEQDINVDYNKIGSHFQLCECGKIMKRVFTPIAFQISKITSGKKKEVELGADRILDARKKGQLHEPTT